MTIRCERCTPVHPQTTFTVETAFGRKKDAMQSLFSVELLLLTRQQNTLAGGAFNQLDHTLAGAISAAVARENFHGALGAHLLVEVSVANAPLRYVLLVGLGSPDQANRPHFCGLHRLAIDTANKLGLKTLGIPIFPGRLTAEYMNLKGMLAVLRCRAAERLQNTPESTLKEIKVFCTAQARRYVESGLEIDRQLCQVCRDPRICQ